MILMYVALFFAGAFICNSIPHIVAGVQGMPFPTPFAKPSGVGKSSPLVNFLWGLFNLLVGGLLWAAYPVRPGPFLGFVVLVLGALASGVFLAVHFGKVRK